MPRLEVRLDCGPCDVDDSVPGLIREGYAAALARAGAVEVEGRTATLTIRGYADRSLLWRYGAGPLAPMRSDSIEAELSVDGVTHALHESARVPFQGIETVARRIGEMVQETLQPQQRNPADRSPSRAGS